MHVHQDAGAQVACVDMEDVGGPVLSLHCISWVPLEWWWQNAFEQVFYVL